MCGLHAFFQQCQNIFRLCISCYTIVFLLPSVNVIHIFFYITQRNKKLQFTPVFDFTMFPEGYISCKELESGNKQSYIIYFHVFEDSKDFMTVYLTDSYCFLTAKVSINEMRRVASNVDVVGDAEIISSLRLV